MPIIIASFLNNSTIPSNINTLNNSLCKPDVKYNMEHYKLLASLPEEDIYLYAMDWKEEEIKQRGIYRDILLNLKGKQREFSCWIIDANPSFKPRLILEDMNEDGKKDLVVITTKSTGTGVFVQEVHIFDIGTYKDIIVMDPMEAIYQNVKTKITKNNGVIINIKVKDDVFTITADKSSVGIWYDDVNFGNIIEYDVISNKLIARLAAQVGFGVNCGDIVMKYEFKNNRLEVNNIDFKEYKNQNIFIY